MITSILLLGPYQVIYFIRICKQDSVSRLYAIWLTQLFMFLFDTLFAICLYKSGLMTIKQKDYQTNFILKIDFSSQLRIF